MNPPGAKRLVGQCALLGIGGGLLWSYAVVVRTLEHPLVGGILVPALMALSVVGVAVWLWSRGASDDRVHRIGVWCGTVTLFGAAIGVINVYSEWLVSGSVQSATVMIANSATVGAVLGLVIGVYDADRRAEHRTVQSQRAQIEGLNERLTVLNRVLRHDIRNDVNVVEGYAEMGASGQIDTEEAFTMIRRKADAIADVSERARQIEALLREDRDDEAVDLARVARAQVIEHEEGYPEALDVSLTVPESAPVAGDVLLESVLDNLLENAVEHAETLPVQVDVAVERTSDGAVLRVADDGPGLPEREQELLDAGRETALEHSSGMGLWLVNWIVREFDGEVCVESGDRGTTVEIWLPEASGEDEDGVGHVSEVGSREAVGDVQAI